MATTYRDLADRSGALGAWQSAAPSSLPSLSELKDRAVNWLDSGGERRWLLTIGAVATATLMGLGGITVGSLAASPPSVYAQR